MLAQAHQILQRWPRISRIIVTMIVRLGVEGVENVASACAGAEDSLGGWCHVRFVSSW